MLVQGGVLGDSRAGAGGGGMLVLGDSRAVRGGGACIG